MLALKIVFSLGLLWLLFTHMEFTPALQAISAHIWFMGLILAVFAVQAICAGYRLPLILRLHHQCCSVKDGVILWLIGLFISQALVTFIAGDASRIWVLRRHGVTLKVATRAVVQDRISGLAALLVMALVAIGLLLIGPWAPPMQQQVYNSLLLVGALCAAMVGGIALSPWLLQFWPVAWQLPRLANALAMLQLPPNSLAQPGALAGVAFLGMLMHSLNALVIWLALHILGESIGFIPVMLVTFPVIFLSLLPISFAGWGVREGAMVTGLALYGISQPTAMAASLLFGFGLLISSLPGGVLLFAKLWGKPGRLAA